jgi:hypothetical protein
MAWPRNTPSDLPGGRPVASAAAPGLTPSPAALRASHPAPAERTAAWPPPAPTLRRPIALTPFWAAAFTRARVLATARRPLLRPRLPAPRDQGKGRRPHFLRASPSSRTRAEKRLFSGTFGCVKALENNVLSCFCPEKNQTFRPPVP